MAKSKWVRRTIAEQLREAQSQLNTVKGVYTVVKVYTKKDSIGREHVKVAKKCHKCGETTETKIANWNKSKFNKCYCKVLLATQRDSLDYSNIPELNRIEKRIEELERKLDNGTFFTKSKSVFTTEVRKSGGKYKSNNGYVKESAF